MPIAVNRANDNRIQMAAKTWTEQQLLVAMNLYTRLPFGKFYARQPEIIEVAEAIGRSPGALAMKLSNFASLDPAHQKRGVGGLKNSSKADHEIWERFEQDWTTMALLSEDAFLKLVKNINLETKRGENDDEPADYTGKTTLSKSQHRIGQEFFRRTVLTAYQDKCCVTGNPVRGLLTASHILPWAVSDKDRLNPRNGLCLAKTQDAAFDKGLITLDDKFKLVVSGSLKDHYGIQTIKENFEKYEGKIIVLPHRFVPDLKFLEYHRNHIFE